MSANLLGVGAAIVWIGLGLGGIWLLLTRTSLLDGVRGNFGLTAQDIRNNFKLIAVVVLAGAAVIGWVGGPVLFGGRP
jgi:hypothetical protein